MENTSDLNRRVFFGAIAGLGASLLPKGVRAETVTYVLDEHCGDKTPLKAPEHHPSGHVRARHHLMRHRLRRAKPKPAVTHVNCPGHKYGPLRRSLTKQNRVKKRIVHVCAPRSDGDLGGYGRGGGNFFDDFFGGNSDYYGGGGGDPSCFVVGSVRMSDGTRKSIDQVAVGDEVRTYFGADRRVLRVVRQEYKRSWWGWRPSLWPVCIKKGALGPGMPEADLVVTAPHAVLVPYGDDVRLVTAATLVNGITITRLPPEGDVLVTYHFELESHDIIDVNGSWAETLFDQETAQSVMPIHSHTGWLQPLRWMLLWIGLRRPKADVEHIWLKLVATS